MNVSRTRGPVNAAANSILPFINRRVRFDNLQPWLRVLNVQAQLERWPVLDASRQGRLGAISSATHERYEKEV